MILSWILPRKRTWAHSTISSIITTVLLWYAPKPFGQHTALSLSPVAVARSRMPRSSARGADERERHWQGGVLQEGRGCHHEDGPVAIPIPSMKKNSGALKCSLLPCAHSICSHRFGIPHLRSSAARRSSSDAWFTSYTRRSCANHARALKSAHAERREASKSTGLGAWQRTRFCCSLSRRSWSVMQRQSSAVGTNPCCGSLRHENALLPPRQQA